MMTRTPNQKEKTLLSIFVFFFLRTAIALPHVAIFLQCHTLSSFGKSEQKSFNPTLNTKAKSMNIKLSNLFHTVVLRGFPLISLAIALAWFAPSPTAEARGGLRPPPDGDYRNETTAEGKDALFSLTTGFGNTALGFNALYSNTEGSYNTAIGRNALLSNTTGFANTAIGAAALFNNTDGFGNTATGRLALFNNTGGENVADGALALYSNTTGFGNTATGAFALYSNTTGAGNTVLGDGAGLNLTTGDLNIDIGNEGVADEANTIRIGTSENQTRTFIAGIRDTTTGNADAIPVYIDSAGQLGTASSSRRFKNEIKPMDQSSQAILGLKPVTFHYKNDSKGTPQFGLIAEEVVKVNPDLVVRDAKGEIYTVRYEAVNAMLLNEFLKQHRQVQELVATVIQLRKDFQTAAARQQKEIGALTASLSEQASQMQKVSDQLEASKPAPRVVVNNQ